MIISALPLKNHPLLVIPNLSILLQLLFPGHDEDSLTRHDNDFPMTYNGNFKKLEALNPQDNMLGFCDLWNNPPSICPGGGGGRNGT